MNKKYKPLMEPKPGIRYILVMGGRGAGRSTAGSQFVKSRLMDVANYFRCAIMRFILGDIRESIYAEIEDRLTEEGLADFVEVRGQQLSFEYGTNKVKGLGFRKSSSEQTSKMKSLASYNCVVIEEADEVDEDDFMQLDLSLRTKKADILVVLLLNPPHKDHWIVKRWFNLIESSIEGFYHAELKKNIQDTEFISTTYHDNIQNFNPSSIAAYEAYKKTKPSYYYSQIKGLISEGKIGRIYKTWKPIKVDEFEALDYPSIFGMDFGFSNDPTALIEVKMHNDDVYVRQHVYQTGLTNTLIGDKFEDCGLSEEDIVYADSAEPKSIQELNDLGWFVEPAEKGQGSLNAGIDMLLSKNVYYTEESTDIADEIQNYMWRLDKNKVPTNTPEDKHNHAMDAIRYAIFTDTRKEWVGFG